MVANNVPSVGHDAHRKTCRDAEMLCRHDGDLRTHYYHVQQWMQCVSYKHMHTHTQYGFTVTVCDEARSFLPCKTIICHIFTHVSEKNLRC